MTRSATKKAKEDKFVKENDGSSDEMELVEDRIDENRLSLGFKSAETRQKSKEKSAKNVRKINVADLLGDNKGKGVISIAETGEVKKVSSKKLLPRADLARDLEKHVTIKIVAKKPWNPTRKHKRNQSVARKHHLFRTEINSSTEK